MTAPTIAGMVIKERSTNFITRMDQAVDDWSKAHLPAWLYKEVTFQPDRWSRPTDYKRAQAFTWLLIVLVTGLLLLAIWFGW